MKRILWILLAACSATAMVACSKSSSNNNGAVVVNCPAGSTYNGAACVNASGQVVQTINNTTNLAYFVDNWSNQKTLTITDRTAYIEFLRTAMGVCNRDQYSGGTADCSNWSNLDIVMSVPDVNNPNGINVTFRSWPQISLYGYYSYSSPGLAGVLGSLFGIPTTQNAAGYFNR